MKHILISILISSVIISFGQTKQVFHKFYKTASDIHISEWNIDKENKNKVFWVSGGVVVLATIIWYIFGKTDFSIETLAFNLILPGIDEEIIFRGILLGLLMSILKENVLSIINPSVLITSILA